MSANLKQFPLPLVTRTILGRERAIVLEKPFTFESTRLGQIEILAGFFCDLASIPRLFWRIFPPAGKYTAAAIVHDFLYWNQATAENATNNILITRDDADATFLEAMEALGVGWFTRKTIYRAVRIGGSSSWSDNYEKRTGKPYPTTPSARLPDFYRNRHTKR